MTESASRDRDDTRRRPPLRVAIVHNALGPESRADESDVLVQTEVVRSALERLGHTVAIVPVDLNLERFVATLRSAKPEVVFNLAESFLESDRLASLPVAVVEQLRLPQTGSDSAALWLTNHKLLTKQRLRQLGLPTPDWLSAAGENVGGLQVRPGDTFLIKPDGEHASLGMDESAVVAARDLPDLQQRIAAQSRRLGVPCFAERFISGREFNVSLLTNGHGCDVLPLAEIDFSSFPAGKTRIVDYRAKWETESFEFQNTPRRFLAPGEDESLQEGLRRLAVRCWTACGVRGHVRVDFRVDEAGQPWILEINTNPCLSPDAGYAAAVARAGLTMDEVVARLVEEALPTHPLRVENETVPPRAAKDSAPGPAACHWRFLAEPADSERVRALVEATGFFYPDEVAIAQELVDERLARGEASGYHFVFAEAGDRLAGYACYGPIAGTRASFDLFWIAVAPPAQGQGWGKRILEVAEKQIADQGGRRVYIETSNREQYRSTRGFYLRCGYLQEAILVDFYGPGDDKVIYSRELPDPLPKS